jgi:hypothetical protein
MKRTRSQSRSGRPPKSSATATSLQRGPDCLHDADLARFAVGLLDRKSLFRVFDHVARCLACAERLAFYREFVLGARRRGIADRSIFPFLTDPDYAKESPGSHSRPAPMLTIADAMRNVGLARETAAEAPRALAAAGRSGKGTPPVRVVVRPPGTPGRTWMTRPIVDPTIDSKGRLTLDVELPSRTRAFEHAVVIVDVVPEGSRRTRECSAKARIDRGRLTLVLAPLVPATPGSVRAVWINVDTAGHG